MGHTWAEIDPEGARRSSMRVDRLLTLRKQLENVPLSEFTAGDFPALHRAMGVEIGDEPNEDDFVRLEKVIKRVKKLAKLAHRRDKYR